MPNRVRHGVGFLVVLLCGAAIAGAAEESYGPVRLVEVAKPKDGIGAGQRAEVQAAIAAYEKRRGPVAPGGKDGLPVHYAFFPQAGVLGLDTFLENFTDQDRGPNRVQDWDCSDYTYDGHQGHDALIRSFREQAIGVPIFAAHDGVVVDTHDGEPDMNTVWEEKNKANYVILDHGDGYIGWYWHMKTGSVAVSPGQTVTAGTQLGLTGSSGFSNWPHLHFETQKDKVWLEPSAGPCRTGESFWVEQPPVHRDFYVAGFYLSRGPSPLSDDDSFLFDEVERTGTFVKGTQTVSFRLDFRNLPTRSPYGVRVLNPKGQVVHEESGIFRNGEIFHLAYVTFDLDVDLNVLGTWRVQGTIDDNLVVDAPFRVVATARQVTNRAPNRVTAGLSQFPESQVLACRIQASLLLEDPDYDLMSYRYEWRVGNRLVRTVTSAVLTDLLAAGTASPGNKVKCKVVPSDGKRSGPAATAQIVLQP
jgi:hypothetical protein